MMHKLLSRVRVVDDTKCSVGYIELATVMDAVAWEPTLKPDMLKTEFRVVNRSLYGKVDEELGLMPNQVVYLIEHETTGTQWIVLPEAIDKPKKTRFRVHYTIPERAWHTTYDVGSEEEALAKFNADFVNTDVVLVSVEAE